MTRPRTPAQTGGRKYAVTLLGIVVCAVLPLVSDRAAVASAITAIGAMVLAFCGANAAVSWGAQRTETASRTTDDAATARARAAVAARRDPATGVEATP